MVFAVRMGLVTLSKATPNETFKALNRPRPKANWKPRDLSPDLTYHCHRASARPSHTREHFSFPSCRRCEGIVPVFAFEEVSDYLGVRVATPD